MNPHLHPWTVSPDGFPADGFTSDRLEYLLRYAILAPSPHNAQPWLFRINVSDVDLYLDPRRALPATDPGGRELHMAMGAALLNLRVAAEYFGQTYRVELLPDPAHRQCVAKLTLHAGGETSSEDIVLFHAIPRRRTNREPFRADPIPDPILEALAAAAAAEGAWLVSLTDDRRPALASLVADADRRQWADHAFRRELAHWIRTDAEHHADGIPATDVGVRDWLSFAGPAIVRTFNRGNNQAAHDVDIALHSPVLAVLGTATDDPIAWLHAGQALQRVLLTAESENVSASFLSQPVEVPDLRPQVAQLAGVEGFPQIVLRLGYGPEVVATPRRDLHGVLLHQDHSKTPPH